jgi:DNA-binding XRE family transcriptional regulator
MIERIREIIDYSQLSTTAFADTIGISRSGLTHLLTGRNQPSLDVARKILAKFPEISTEWLIMGMGEMMRPDEKPSTEDAPAGKPVEQHLVENEKNMRQTDLFGEFGNLDDSGEDVPVQNEAVIVESVEEEAVATQPVVEPESVPVSEAPSPAVRPQEAPIRVRKTSEPKPAPANAKRDKHQPVVSQEKKLQRIVFFYDDHSFEVYGD